MARMVSIRLRLVFPGAVLNAVRTAEQAEGNKTVGVDPTVITACKVASIKSTLCPFSNLNSRCS